MMVDFNLGKKNETLTYPFLSTEESINVSIQKMWILKAKIRGGSRAAARSKMEGFVIIVNGWKPLSIIAKHSILDVVVALDLPLKM